MLLALYGTVMCDSVVEQLGGKQLVMTHLSHEDPNVRYEALLAVQKLMVHNWYVGIGPIRLCFQVMEIRLVGWSLTALSTQCRSYVCGALQLPDVFLELRCFNHFTLVMLAFTSWFLVQQLFILMSCCEIVDKSAGVCVLDNTTKISYPKLAILMIDIS